MSLYVLKRAKTRQKLAEVYLRFTGSVQYLARVRILSFTELAIVRYEHLRSLKLNISKMDLRVAAIALEESAVVVTRNVRDFQRIPKLTIEDWSQ